MQTGQENSHGRHRAAHDYPAVGYGRHRQGCGYYASASEVVRDALRDWKVKRALQLQEFVALKTDIDKGLADLAAGRVRDFDAERIMDQGRKLLARRFPSA
jgi:antitoxin ParD1/3/4